MTGKIMKGIAGFYYVHVEGRGVYECKAKGIFRKEGIKPLVGDDVGVDVLDEAEMLGNIREILPRKSTLLRPAVANVDQALILFAIVKPNPNFNLLDRFLIRMEQQKLPTIICFNKEDIASPEEKETLRKSYETCGYQVLFISVLENRGLDQVRELLAGKTTALAGPSGVGKSSLINQLSPGTQMETGRRSSGAGTPPDIRRSLRWGMAPISWIRRALPLWNCRRSQRRSLAGIIRSSGRMSRFVNSVAAPISASRSAA